MISPDISVVSNNSKNSTETIQNLIIEKQETNFSITDINENVIESIEENEIIIPVLKKIKRKRGRPRLEENVSTQKKKRKYKLLSEKDFYEVKIRLEKKANISELAKIFEISENTVRNISKTETPPQNRGGSVYRKVFLFNKKIFLNYYILIHNKNKK
jgi:hypothetical protein